MNPFRTRIAYAPDGGGGAAVTIPGAVANVTLPGAAVTPPNDETAYVTMLRREAADRRKEADDAKAETAKAKEDATKAVTAATEAANRRIINAELRAEATKAGMLDLDGLKLLDLDKAGVTIDADGTVKGAAEALVALKKAKPWAFVGTGSTSPPGSPPPPAGGGAKHAKDMTTEEYAAAKRAGGFR